MEDPEGFCAGCLVSACLILQSIALYQVAGTPPDNYHMYFPHIRQWIGWQDRGPQSVPARPRTWGSVKALYW